jgi:predicted lipoprotein with Yx(FWY)xxD motif
MHKAVFAALALSLAFAAQANPTIERNGMLASKDGRTLYTFDKDSAGVSNCSGGCLAAWPAFTVADPSAAGGDFSVLTRSDGTKQWAHKGKPLYFFAGDAQPGEANGDKQGGVWHVVRPGARQAAGQSPGYASTYSYTY